MVYASPKFAVKIFDTVICLFYHSECIWYVFDKETQSALHNTIPFHHSR